MDHAIIDAVARAVATGASRRQVLRLLAMGTVIGWRPGRAGAVPARLACGGGTDRLRHRMRRPLERPLQLWRVWHRLPERCL